MNVCLQELRGDCLQEQSAQIVNWQTTQRMNAADMKRSLMNHHLVWSMLTELFTVDLHLEMCQPDQQHSKHLSNADANYCPDPSASFLPNTNTANPPPMSVITGIGWWNRWSSRIHAMLAENNWTSDKWSSVIVDDVPCHFRAHRSQMGFASAACRSHWFWVWTHIFYVLCLYLLFTFAIKQNQLPQSAITLNKEWEWISFHACVRPSEWGERLDESSETGCWASWVAD